MSYPRFWGDEKEGVEDVEGGDRHLDRFHEGPSLEPIQIYPPPRRILMADWHSRSQVGGVDLGRLGGGEVDRSERDRHPRFVLRCLRESPDGCFGCP